MSNTINPNLNTGAVGAISGNVSFDGNVQMEFAKLQIELAGSKKESALDRIEGIRENQAESARLTEAINALRNLKTLMDDQDLDDLDISIGGTIPADISDEDRQNQITKMKSYLTEANSQMALAEKGKTDTAQGNANKAAVHAAYPQHAGWADHTLMPEDMETDLKAWGVKLDNTGNDRIHSDGQWRTCINSMEVRYAYLQAGDLCSKYGIDLPTTGKLTPERIDTVIASLQSVQEQVGSDIQQVMVFAQDDMGQYNAYTTGANSAVSSYSDLLKELARG